MRKILYAGIFIVLTQEAVSQIPFNVLLDNVKSNNKTLSSGRQLSETRKIEAKTGIYLPNPTVTFDKLTHTSGDYSELLVTQSFDFPSAYFQKSKIAGLTALQSEDLFKQLELEVLTKTAITYAELIKTNRMKAILSGRGKMADRLRSGFEKKLQVGESNIFESDRVHVEAARVQSEMQINESRRKSLLLKLAELNGGIGIEVNDTIFPVMAGLGLQDSTMNNIVADYPQLRYLQNESLVAGINTDLQKSLSLPKFEAGYRQDKNKGVSYRGFHAGISIPLFENKNTIRSAKARQEYVARETEAYKLTLEKSILQLIIEYDAAQQSYNDMNDVIKKLKTSKLLLIAFNSGQIGYNEYFTGYDNYNQTLLYLEDLLLRTNSLRLQLYVLSGLK